MKKTYEKILYLRRRNGRVVDCGGLENRCPGDWTGGSNPSFSAPYCRPGHLQVTQLLFSGYRRMSLLMRSIPEKQKSMRRGAYLQYGAGFPEWDHEPAERESNPSEFMMRVLWSAGSSSRDHDPPEAESNPSGEMSLLMRSIPEKQKGMRRGAYLQYRCRFPRMRSRSGRRRLAENKPFDHEYCTATETNLNLCNKYNPRRFSAQ